MTAVQADAAPALEPRPPESAGDRLALSLRRRRPALAHALFDRLTPQGRAFLIVFVVVSVIALVVGRGYPLYYLASLLLAVAVVDQALGVALRPPVELTRVMPDRVAAGARVPVAVRLRPVGRRGARDVCVTELQPPPEVRCGTSARRVWVAPGEAVELTYALEATRRGVYDLAGPVALFGFPFGLYQARRRARAPLRLVVHPRFAELGAIDLPVGARHQPGGLALVSRVGESEELVGGRPWRQGDRLRDIDARAWARVGFPVVREYQQEYLQRIALVVDSFVPRPRARPLDAFEAAVSLGAGVAHALSRLEYVIDLFAVGPDLYHLQAGRSLAYLESILDILACIEPCRRSPFEALGPRLRDAVGQIGAAVVVLLDWDAERAAFTRELADCGVAVKVVVVRDGDPTLDPGGATFAGGPVRLLTPAQARAGGDRL